MGKRTETTVVLAISAVTFFGVALAGGVADAAPYGGCKEAWMAPKSAGAQTCRGNGWIVRPRLVVGPRKVVRYSTLPSCRVEDASNGPVPCSWNFGTTDGNGLGDAYYVTGSNERPHFHNVKVAR